ncbi:hypothetical protein CWB68_11995 [Pseudoalteromonas sp. S979]|jgi:hypothetical protein|nr:endodeoxyribonuclease [Pseudoalteromonas agarivorans S816]TMS65501.1 hypothetical protein CWB83_12925 [Pseudoalteromonas sp. S1691]TMS67527.1 hypothetical protein CWB86_14760 [Pseudoalteromonas sp. S1731]TMS73250.1 hypothetical protein CWB88_12190 [Pseudoalteromonas sp. S1941]TMS77914.1 hypothetical protein CWB82_07955 [Pseudoalteromonas sp. S1690]TMS85814.1 hypothetical protein CWB70_08285 [Pseudoalteromonas sp. S981]TMS88352.1 hypothetical protein CWB69_15500 [Pseudoalteromonas sp. S980]
MFGYIYKTLNLETRKIYIGQHRRRGFAPNYFGSGTALKAAIKAYGRDCFKCKVIERCDTLKELNEREIFWIEKYQSRNPLIGYNLAVGGAGCCWLYSKRSFPNLKSTLQYYL